MVKGIGTGAKAGFVVDHHHHPNSTRKTDRLSRLSGCCGEKKGKDYREEDTFEDNNIDKGRCHIQQDNHQVLGHEGTGPGSSFEIGLVYYPF